MFKYYSLLSISFSLLSCSTQMKYLGNSSTPTKNVDVYVDASAIKKSYTIIGKGYFEPAIGRYNVEKVQKKATSLAKEKGADAILFQDYFVTEERTGVYHVGIADSSGRKLSAIRSPSTSPVVTSSQNILFLKYD